MSRYKAEKIFLENEPIILYSSTSPVLFSDNKSIFEWQTNILVNSAFHSDFSCQHLWSYYKRTNQISEELYHFFSDL